MTDGSWRLSHRQLVSAVISLVMEDDTRSPAWLRDLGYRLGSLELPMLDGHNRSYRLDLHLVKVDLNLSLLVDCKTHPDNLKADQVEKYLATTGRDVVIHAGLALEEPRAHRADAVFFVLPSVEASLRDVIARSPVTVEGYGLVRVTATRIEVAHDELSDPELSASLTAGWTVDVNGLPLERLPFETDAPRWELANAVLQTLIGMFTTGQREFGVDDVCIASNELWTYLDAHHEHLRNRVRKEIRAIRGTALKGWIDRIDAGSSIEERWRFTKGRSNRANVLAALARRHQKYLAVLLEQRDPVPNDFEEIDPEQLTLPFPTVEG